MTAKALLERIIKIRKAIDYRRTKIDALIEQAETPWDDIAAEMGFCERHIYRLHNAAVEELDNRLKDVM